LDRDADARPAAAYDAYALPPEAVREPPRTWGGALRQVGPGLILAGAIVGTGELIATTHLGAKAGFALLWLVILSCFVKVFVQAELGRYTISSGRTTLSAFRELGGVGRLFGWWWIGMMLLSQLQLGAMVGGIGQACHMALPGFSPWLGGLFSGGSTAHNYLSAHPEFPWAALTAVSTSLLLAIGSYRVVEFGTTLMVVVFTLATVACVMLLPAAGHPIDWRQVKQGLTFSLPPNAILAAVAMFGITGVGATELVAYPYWCIEKGYARKAGARDASDAWLSRARGWLRVMRLDVFVSLVVYTIATLAFYFLGAATLQGRPSQGLPAGVGGMLAELTYMYTPIMGHRAATWFIVVGVFAVLYSTLFAGTAANSRTLADFLHVNGLVPLRSAADRIRWVRLFCIVFPLIDLVLFMTLKSPVKMVITSGFVQALTLPMIAAAAVYLRYTRTDRRLRPTPLWDVFLWASMAALFATAAYGVWDNVRKLTT
jgi:manganese transport protein